MISHSDWHIHSDCSYDASQTLGHIAENADKQGLRCFGITDHANFNDEKFMGDLRASAKAVTEGQKQCPNMVLGVELTPIEKPEFDHIAKTGTREGYVAPIQSEPFEIELAATKEELMALGVRYAVGASHWRVDVPNGRALTPDLDACIKEWFRQQMWLANDERVTILGHPWYNGKGIWYEDFDIIPRAMKLELAAALKENGKFVECSTTFFRDREPGNKRNTTEKFRHQYAEYLREMFEMGIPITYGSDAHHSYEDVRPQVEKYLLAAGFADGDFSDLSEKDFW